MIQCEHLTLGYGGKAVASDISFSVGAGDYLCVLGENGSGKTTLLQTLLGLQKPLSGRITLADGKKGIGYLPQQDASARDFPASVWEVTVSGCPARRGVFLRKENAQRARRALEQVGMSAYARRPYRALSGGQQQRVLLARALCAADRLLLLDEPTAGLDAHAASTLYDILRDLHRSGMTVLMITHDPAALRDATHVLHIGTHGARFCTKAQYR